jgi:hypothetical protein
MLIIFVSVEATAEAILAFFVVGDRKMAAVPDGRSETVEY